MVQSENILLLVVAIFPFEVSSDLDVSIDAVGESIVDYEVVQVRNQLNASFVDEVHVVYLVSLVEQ